MRVLGINSEGFPLRGYFFLGAGGGWVGGPCPEILPTSSPPPPPPENHDGESSQNGNLVFQKCWLGLGGYGNGLDLLKCWF